MGFDTECIIDIQTYPGEYFCPVCCTLVYPNEAFQTQCSHLYCKPCLAHVAYGSKACPYDGYLVTESNSKPLMDSNKMLGELIGQVKVHCLFVRSGCTWVGLLSDVTSHCFECSFGSSPVVCNICGMQLVHRQVHDHAQSCPHWKNPNQQQIANPQAPPSGPVYVPTPEQWYQQQYQQFYQLCAGYDPYQQPHQQSYSLQQPSIQPNQQHALHVHGQPQSHGYSQSQPHLLQQPQSQSYPIQVQQQPYSKPLAQAQVQPQPQLLPQAPSQVQFPPQGQPQLRTPIQPLVSNYQVVPEQLTPLMWPQTRIPPEILPPPPHSQPNQFPPCPQPVGMQPPAQHPQVSQFQQPPLQMHHYHSFQAHGHSQPQFQNQSSNHSNLGMQPLVPQNHNQFLPQPPHLPASSVSGHHSYQQHQPAQQMQSGASQQNPIHQHPASWSVLQQPAVMRPPLSPCSFPPRQLSIFLAPQGKVPGVPPSQQQFSALAQPPSHPPQHGTFMNPFQQTVPQQIAKQQPFLAPAKGQLHQQSHLQQQPLQPQLRPQSQQSQNYVGRPTVSDQGMHPQNCSRTSVGLGAASLAGPAQPGSNLTSTNQNLAKSTVLEKEDSSSKCALPIETTIVGANVSKKESHSGVDSNILQQVEDCQIRKEAVVMDSSSTEFGNIPHTAVSWLEVQVGEHPPKIPRPQGSGSLPPPRQSLPLPLPCTHLEAAPACFGPPHGNFESLSAPQRPVLTTLAVTHGIMGKTPQLCQEGQSGLQNVVRLSEGATSKDKRSGSSHLSGSGEGVPLRKNCGNEATFWRNNAETALDSKFCSHEHLNPIPMEPTRPLGQASMSLDKAPIGSSYEAGMKLNIGSSDHHSRFLPPQHASAGRGHGDVLGPGHQFQRQIKQFSSQSPGGEYLGMSPPGFGGLSSFPRGTSGFKDIDTREAHRLAEGSRSFNLPSDPNQNCFHNSRFPPMSSHPGRGDIDASKNLRFGEHTSHNQLHNSMRTDEAFGQQGPGPFMRGEHSGPAYLPDHFKSEAAGHGTFPGQSYVGELGFPGNLSHHLSSGESVRGDRPSIPTSGEPGIRSNYSLNAGNFIDKVESFDQSRKRKPTSMGWCRICNIDCDTVERLEMHSQTREHHKMAMDMVETIKQRTKKKQRISAGYMAHEGESSSRDMVTDCRCCLVFGEDVWKFLLQLFQMDLSFLPKRKRKKMETSAE